LQRRVESVVTEKNWHRLVLDELTDRRAERAHWPLGIYAIHVSPTPFYGAYCNALPLGHWSVNQKLNHPCQFSYIALNAPSLWNSQSSKLTCSRH